MGKLYYGDNLQILREKIPDESVDLIYLDPPFNSNATYNVLFSEKSGEKSESQIKAFTDTWEWTKESEKALDELISGPNIPSSVSESVQAIVNLLGRNNLSAYLVMMAIRLVELHRVLKQTGSIYLHCDPTASHYLKILLDRVFGIKNFKNEIIWPRTYAHSDFKQGARAFGRIHDVLLFYTKSDTNTWNPIYLPYEEDYVKKTFKSTDEQGRSYQTVTLTASKPGGDTKFEWHGITPPDGRYWAYSRANLDKMLKEGKIVFLESGIPRMKKYLDESPGVPIQDVWNDLKRLSTFSKERMGYPTQKPLSLLERIVTASSNEGDVVLDPFCGCGTAIHAAQKLKREWIGIDITHLAINLIRNRLNDAFRIIPEVEGEPTDLQGARDLAEQVDRFQFQAWALSLIGARPSDKKVGDHGIDGLIFNKKEKGYYRGIVQVKSGNVKPADIRDLRGVIERDKADYGIFLTLNEPSKDMMTEAVQAGFITTAWDEKVPRLQILTIEELLSGKKPAYPSRPDTFMKAEQEKRQVSKKGKDTRLDLFENKSQKED